MGDKLVNRYFILIVLLLFANFFNTSSQLIPTLIANLSFALLFALVALCTKVAIRKITVKQLAFFFSLLMALTFVAFNVGINLQSALRTIFQLGYIILLVIVASRIDIKEVNTSSFKKLNKVMASSLYVFYIIRITGYDIMFSNLASLGHISFGLFFLNVLFYATHIKGKSGIIHSLVYVPLLVASQGRNMLIACMLALFIYKSWDLICRTFLNIVLTFFSLIAVIYTITVEYPKWYYDVRFIVVDQWVQRVTGKSFFSGRQVIWRNIMRIMQGSEWLGHGTGTLYGFFMEDNRSAHNQYLQLYMQNGIIGVVVLILFLFSLWMTIASYSFHPDLYIRRKSRLCGAFLLSFMYLNTFTVAMLQNSMASALLMWFIVGLGLYRPRSKG